MTAIAPRLVRPVSAGRAAIRGVSVAICVLALWSVVYALFVSDLQQRRSQHELYATFRAELAQATAPIGGSIAPGSPVALISIPEAGLRDVVVVEGTTSGNLRAGPGHLRSTPLPGQAGVSVLMGRSSMFAAPFAHIGKLTYGESFSVTTGEGKFTYRVLDVRHKGDLIPAPPATGTGRLMIETAVTSGLGGAWTPSGVVYVDAVLQGKPAGDAGPRPGISADEKAMAGESGPLLLMELVLLLQLLLIVTVIAAWAQSRWARGQLWLVWIPVVLGALWGLSDTAVRLLPNLL